MKWKANWIWNKRSQYNQYNDSVVVTKQFKVSNFRNVVIHVTADTFYRLYINDVWVNDGPARAWPEHYSYDSININAYLNTGTNNVKIIARYWGTGDFHHVPQQAGLLAQIDITTAKGSVKSIPTNSTWQVADYKPLLRNTPKVSIQMEPVEYFDTRLSKKLTFKNATSLCKVDGGPWKNLTERKTPLLTRKEVCARSFLSAKAVESPGDYWCLYFRNLIHPHIIEANRNVYSPFILTSVLRIRKKTKIKFNIMDSTGNHHPIFIGGKARKSNDFTLMPGRHAVLFVWDNLSNMHITDLSFQFQGDKNAKLENPVQPNHENPWCFIPYKEFAFADNDMDWQRLITRKPKLAEKVAHFQRFTKTLISQIEQPKDIKSFFGERTQTAPADKMFVRDNYHKFVSQLSLPDQAVRIDNPSGLLYNNPEQTTVYPPRKGDVQLVYDLGQQCCGYYHFDLITEEEGQIDIHGVEYITPGGQIQHTLGNRNGMTYITKKGLNKYISLKRRSGRYLYITLRNFKQPIQIRQLGLIESTYPVSYQGSFTCSDEALNKIWDISARTLELCMEDTFTDCPLYEQTLWVGDARNESLFAYTLFGGVDIARNCIEITAQSLNRYPITGCQVPSSWDCILPAWSFLWGISVWEHYWYTDDKKWLKKLWPAVRKNLEGAFRFIEKNGLFSADFWNLFDWAKIDQEHDCVLHNTMFMIGAIDAAIQCANTLQISPFAKTLAIKRKQLIAATNKLWNEKRKCYPDSIHEDGTISPSDSQHTAFLSILYDIVPSRYRKHVIQNMVKPAPNTIRVGSPFAIMFLFEAMEKLGLKKEIIQSIRDDYKPMLRLSATTVWESFARGTLGHNEFPTRSHCHAWSSAPVYFLNRIVLGLRQTSSGCRTFELSPNPMDLKFANGSVATPLGPVSVEWHRDGQKMYVAYKAPAGIKINFKRNTSLKGLSLKIERK